MAMLDTNPPVQVTHVYCVDHGTCLGVYVAIHRPDLQIKWSYVPTRDPCCTEPANLVGGFSPDCS